MPMSLAQLSLVFLAALDGGAPVESKDASLPAPKAAARPFRLTVGGDVTLGYHYEEWFDEKVDAGVPREEMFAYGFKEVKAAVKKDDLFLVNLECPFTERGEKIPKNFNFKARPEFVQSLIAGGVDAVSLANNHLMDYGLTGLLDTLAALEEAKIPYFGAGRNLAEARRPLILTKNGVKVAFLGYFFLGERNIEPKEVIATATTPGVAGHASDVEVMERMMVEDIRAARAQADLVIPFFHWGREGTTQPEPYQVRLSHAAAEAGAAAVLGSHPHVLQGIELHQGVPVAYSLGNFVFGGNWNPKNKDSALLHLTFSPGGFQGMEITPLKTDRYPEKPVQPYVLKGAEAEKILVKLAAYSASFPVTIPELEKRRPPPDAGAADAGR